jgi:tetratricopeptide (TPR) repeat protein
MSDAELARQIEQLTAAQLVEAQSADEYAFRHALTREAVYGTLLVRERRRFHRAIAETLVRTGGQPREAQTAALAYHYYEAGDWEQALIFARRAGEKAQAMYAPREAIQNFSRALDAAAQLGRQAPAELQRARGQAYETIGEFERARADYEAALAASHGAGDRRAEWQALVDLGFLWAARDYARTDDYLRQALEQARAVGDAAIIAQSLNRLGNWHANVEQPGESRRLHEEALAIFEGLGDRPGIAATLDLLGLASAFTGDMIGSEAYYRRAVALFRELGDRVGLASSLASMSECGVMYYVDLMIASGMKSAEGQAFSDEARAIARAIGWRAGEAYALLGRSGILATRGNYAEALAEGHAGLAIALEIEHQQWVAFAHMILGMLYFDLLAFAESQAHLARGLAMARTVGSQNFERAITGIQGIVLAQHGSPRERAQATAAITAVLGDEAAGPDALPADGEPVTLGQRLCWQARADLATASGKPRLALQILDRTVQALPHGELAAEQPPPRIALARAAALARAEKSATTAKRQPHATPDEVREAVVLLQRVQSEPLASESPPHQWRLHLALGRLYRAQRRYPAARLEFDAARQIVAALAERIGDDGLRRKFLERAMAMIPPLKKTSHANPV